MIAEWKMDAGLIYVSKSHDEFENATCKKKDI